MNDQSHFLHHTVLPQNHFTSIGESLNRSFRMDDTSWTECDFTYQVGILGYQNCMMGCDIGFTGDFIQLLALFWGPPLELD